MQGLPIGIQSFNNLRTENGGYLYVDKTQHIYNMINGGRIFFLSRPRRFGKSLLVSAMNELFNGNKDIFEGLYIYDKWDWTKKNPVIRLDFSIRSNKTTQDLTISLSEFLDSEASNSGIKLEKSNLSDKFAELIIGLHLSAGEKVVVLIDEYDKPILDVIENPETLKGNRDLLHDFYQVLKGTDDHLRFVFMTGVSKFAGLSIFSALNNINDITITEKYSTICGYTQEELESVFAEHIERTANKLKMSKPELLGLIGEMYDGYSWDGTIRVYNPFSTLLFFENGEFQNYWFRTGTPTFLINMIKEREQVLDVLEPQKVDSLFFESADIEEIDEVSLLFQTGYLTIKEKIIDKDNISYTLAMPNTEVRKAFLNHLLSSYSKYPAAKIQGLREKVKKQIKDRDEAGFEQSFRILLARVPFVLQQDNEAYYHSMFLIWLYMLDFDIQGEVLTNLGRIDAVLRFPDYNIVAECKYSSQKTIETLLEEALKQISDKKYYEVYMDKPIVLLGIAFTGKDIKCKFEELKIK
ncbi:MAG: ATP-binding protein [Elusimicrobiota bacterium]|jgi:hypothetical protein|nr:ATP-binding protein [Elusimicrobiota bacterium]